jgi:hypothetical protein
MFVEKANPQAYYTRGDFFVRGTVEGLLKKNDHLLYS